MSGLIDVPIGLRMPAGGIEVVGQTAAAGAGSSDMAFRSPDETRGISGCLVPGAARHNSRPASRLHRANDLQLFSITIYYTPV
jgi:hypothetical protein